MCNRDILRGRLGFREGVFFWYGVGVWDRVEVRDGVRIGVGVGDRVSVTCEIWEGVAGSRYCHVSGGGAHTDGQAEMHRTNSSCEITVHLSKKEISLAEKSQSGKMVKTHKNVYESKKMYANI